MAMLPSKKTPNFLQFPAILSILLLIFQFLPNPAYAQFAGGDGNASDPWQVETIDELQLIADDTTYLDKHFIQTVDIDASDTENWNEGEGFELIKKRWKPTADQRVPVFSQSLPDSGDPIPEIYQTRIDRGTEEVDRTNNAPDYHRNYIYVEALGYALGSVNYQRRLPWYNIAAGGGIGIVPGQSTPMNALDRLNAISLFVLKQYKLTNHFWYGFGLGGTYDYVGYTDYDNFYDPFYVTMALNRYSVSREYRGYIGAGLYYVRWEENWRILPAIRIGISF